MVVNTNNETVRETNRVHNPTKQDKDHLEI